MKLEELEKLAKEATPGPWYEASDLPTYAVQAENGVRVVQTANQNNTRHFGASESWQGCNLPNAAFIAAHNPERMKRIYALLRECREVLMSGTSYDEAVLLAKLEDL